MTAGEIENLEKKIFTISSEADFEQISRIVYNYQIEHIEPFGEYHRLITVKNAAPEKRPFHFLPVEFFKTHVLLDRGKEAELVFRSSGTTGTSTSIHFVSRTGLYKESFRKGFRLFYGDETQYCILALLPSYLERTDSSLVFMMEDLIRRSGHPASGFYMNNHRELTDTLAELKSRGQKTWLIGTPFSLLDFTDQDSISFPGLTLVETGGMKGRRKETIKEELYEMLKQRFGVPSIHSEYGMTELLSQAWSVSGGRFRCPPWMRILVHEITDPLSEAEDGSTGILSIIDLANLHSCSFIQTQDIGRKNPDGSFEVLGRLDYSDVRGCSLLTA